MTYPGLNLFHKKQAMLAVSLTLAITPLAVQAQGVAPVPGQTGIPPSQTSPNPNYIAPVTQKSAPQQEQKPQSSKLQAPPTERVNSTPTETNPVGNSASGSPQSQPTQTQPEGQTPPVAQEEEGQVRRYTSIPSQAPLNINLSHEMTKEEYKQKFKEWNELQKNGAEAFRLCQYGIAERTLAKAVKKAREFGPGDVQFAKSSGELGRLLTVRGRFDEAEKLLQEELSLTDMAYDSDKSQMIDKMGAMITFYLNYGTKDKAFPLTEDMLDFIDGKIREQRSQKSKTVTIGKDGSLVGWAGTAQLEDRDPLLEWSIILDKLGYLYRVQGELDMADRLFKAALDIKATVLGKKHLSLANSYDSLGTVCLSRKDYKEAESYFQDALTITENILKPGNPKIYSRIDKLARCKVKEKKFGEARALYARARNEFAYNKGIKQQALYRLGCLYSDARNFSAAAPALRQALNLAIKNHGSQSIKLVPYLKKYAYVSYYLGNRGKNANLKARANNINPVVKALKPSVQMKAGTWSKKSKK